LVSALSSLPSSNNGINFSSLPCGTTRFDINDPPFNYLVHSLTTS
jgi:hypothetical protein